MAEALDNLILNALQHTPRGGAVRITAEKDAGRLIIHVADTGQGVAPEFRVQLFEPFASTRHGGMGLGLIAARDIVSAHNGTLRLLDRDTRGAVFEIELPWQES